MSSRPASSLFTDDDKMIERTKQVGKKRIKEEDLIRFPPGQHVVIIKLLKIVSYLV